MRGLLPEDPIAERHQDLLPSVGRVQVQRHVDIQPRRPGQVVGLGLQHLHELRQLPSNGRLLRQHRHDLLHRLRRLPVVEQHEPDHRREALGPWIPRRRFPRRQGPQHREPLGVIHLQQPPQDLAQLPVPLPRRRHVPTGPTLQLGPPGGLVHVPELHHREVEELPQPQRPVLVLQRPQLSDQRPHGRRHDPLEVVQDHRLGLAVQVQVTARGQVGEALLHVPDQLPARPTGQRPQPQVGAEGSVLLPDEVQHRAHRLLRVQPQAAAQLLQEHRRRLRRPQQQDRVHRRHVHTLGQHVHGEDDVDLPVPQGVQLLLAHGGRGLAAHRHRGDAGLTELAGHVLRMRHRHAEPEGPHAPHVGDHLPQRPQHLRRPGVVPVDHVDRLEVCERSLKTDICDH